MPPFLRNHDPTVDIYVERIRFLVTRLDIESLVGLRFPKEQYLSHLLDMLWGVPFNVNLYTWPVKTQDYVQFYDALVADNIDVTILPSPK